MFQAESRPDAAENEDGSPWLLVSDLDDTLTGDDEALALFVAQVQASKGLRVCINSSRPASSAAGTLDAFPAHFRPDALITAMGTEIYVDGRSLADWEQQFADWDRAVFDRLMQRLGYAAHPPELQTPYKASFIVPAGPDVQRAMAAMQKTDQQAQVVLSGRSNFDILPPHAGKGRATQRLASEWRIPRGRLVVAGDSLNDLAMLEAGDRGVIVANAHPELRAKVQQMPSVYQARASHAAGVIEGLRHWGAPLAEVSREGLGHMKRGYTPHRGAG